MLIPLGLFGWVLMACLVAGFAHLLLPSSHGKPLIDFGASLIGCLLGGGAATALGFGGLAGFDARGLVFATLAAMLLVLLGRILGDSRQANRSSD